MKQIIIILFFFIFPFSQMFSQDKRNEIRIPGILGYNTYKGDFHMHTIFSDGKVLPDVRVEEAWREGLDIISITDHVELWNPLLPDNQNLPYEMAKEAAQKREILLIKGAEITRGLPEECGHMNALFLQDVNKLKLDSFREVLDEAERQGAFLFWNHPGWYVHQPDTTQWFEIFTELMQKEQLHGIEIVNWKRWYPNGLIWCMDKDLSVLANSDVHGLSHWLYDFASGDHRPMTLVFAEELSEEAIKRALFEGRTLAFFKRGFYNLLLGKEDYLEELLKASIEIKVTEITEKHLRLQMINHSGLDFHLVKDNPDPSLNYRKNYFIYARSQEEITVLSNEIQNRESISLGFRVVNLLSYPENALKTDFLIMLEKMPSF